jgi:hypothetical protein
MPYIISEIGRELGTYEALPLLLDQEILAANLQPHNGQMSQSYAALQRRLCYVRFGLVVENHTVHHYYRN